MAISGAERLLGLMAMMSPPRRPSRIAGEGRQTLRAFREAA